MMEPSRLGLSMAMVEVEGILSVEEMRRGVEMERRVRHKLVERG